jgi:hypothetical protein
MRGMCGANRRRRRYRFVRVLTGGALLEEISLLLLDVLATLQQLQDGE